MKKRIDDLYRERFRDVETTPPKEAWENISAGLPEKKKRRLLPFWYEIAGTAAALALLFTLYQAFNGATRTEVQLVGLDFNRSQLEIDKVTTGFQESMLQSSIILEAIKMNTMQGWQNTTFPSKQAVQNSGNYFARISEGSSGGDKTELTYTFPNYLKSNPLIITPFHSDKILTEKGSEGSVPTKEIEENENLLSETSLNFGTLPKAEENEELAEVPGPSRRFSVTTTAAAVYFDNLRGGNALDKQFAANSSSGEISLAYGLNVAYQLSSRVKLRTGVSKVNLSHKTNDIGFVAAARSEALNNPEIYASPAFSTLASSEASNGSINQRLGFIEIPLEMEFTIVEKKIGLNIIGGASTFFLDENMISHSSPMATTELGKANNLNNVSFSTNIGLGINYNISQQFQFNLEPIFKYQLNTYNNNSANLSPYIFGVYSGLRFKF